MRAAVKQARPSSRPAVATIAPAAPSYRADLDTYEGPVSDHPWYSDPLNLRNIVDCGSHSSVDAWDSVYTMGHGAVEGPAVVYYHNGAPLFHVLTGGNLAITEEMGAHLYMTVVMGQVPRCLTCPLFLSGSCGNR